MESKYGGTQESPMVVSLGSPTHPCLLEFSASPKQIRCTHFVPTAELTQLSREQALRNLIKLKQQKSYSKLDKMDQLISVGGQERHNGHVIVRTNVHQLIMCNTGDQKSWSELKSLEMAYELLVFMGSMAHNRSILQLCQSGIFIYSQLLEQVIYYSWLWEWPTVTLTQINNTQMLTGLIWLLIECRDPFDYVHQYRLMVSCREQGPPKHSEYGCVNEVMGMLGQSGLTLSAATSLLELQIQKLNIINHLPQTINNNNTNNKSNAKNDGHKLKLTKAVYAQSGRNSKRPNLQHARLKQSMSMTSGKSSSRGRKYLSNALFPTQSKSARHDLLKDTLNSTNTHNSNIRKFHSFYNLSTTQHSKTNKNIANHNNSSNNHIHQHTNNNINSDMKYEDRWYRVDAIHPLETPTASFIKTHPVSNQQPLGSLLEMQPSTIDHQHLANLLKHRQQQQKVSYPQNGQKVQSHTNTCQRQDTLTENIKRVLKAHSLQIYPNVYQLTINSNKSNSNNMQRSAAFQIMIYPTHVNHTHSPTQTNTYTHQAHHQSQVVQNQHSAYKLMAPPKIQPQQLNQSIAQVQLVVEKRSNYSFLAQQIVGLIKAQLKSQKPLWSMASYVYYLNYTLLWAQDSSSQWHTQPVQTDWNNITRSLQGIKSYIHNNSSHPLLSKYLQLDSVQSILSKQIKQIKNPHQAYQIRQNTKEDCKSFLLTHFAQTGQYVSNNKVKLINKKSFIPFLKYLMLIPFAIIIILLPNKEIQEMKQIENQRKALELKNQMNIDVKEYVQSLRILLNNYLGD